MHYGSVIAKVNKIDSLLNTPLRYFLKIFTFIFDTCMLYLHIWTSFQANMHYISMVTEFSTQRKKKYSRYSGVVHSLHQSVTIFLPLFSLKSLHSDIALSLACYPSFFCQSNTRGNQLTPLILMLPIGHSNWNHE